MLAVALYLVALVTGQAPVLMVMRNTASRSAVPALYLPGTGQLGPYGFDQVGSSPLALKGLAWHLRV